MVYLYNDRAEQKETWMSEQTIALDFGGLSGVITWSLIRSSTRALIFVHWRKVFINVSEKNPSSLLDRWIILVKFSRNKKIGPKQFKYFLV